MYTSQSLPPLCEPIWYDSDEEDDDGGAISIQSIRQILYRSQKAPKHIQTVEGIVLNGIKMKIN